MVTLPPIVWAMAGAIALCGIAALVYALAVFVRRETRIHLLKIEVAELRIRYLARIKAVRDGGDPADLPTDLESLRQYLLEDAPIAEDVIEVGTDVDDTDAAGTDDDPILVGAPVGAEAATPTRKAA